ncbi:hypothetical protein LOTGIDRAFT_228487 [Lottia gigantea]|uniref:BTB domain-containing protein n=1 Tax=Lottia gigantea TaxID=225164 RepID=V3ZQJ0_LOTGI|nr:hypothetical protein LOTGIDRAFT_228487 [Lottia gigantea]ESO93668.1 hypothetical protein LOTGIDRAFT_228487 [Lottia gigantea]
MALRDRTSHVIRPRQYIHERKFKHVVTRFKKTMDEAEADQAPPPQPEIDGDNILRDEDNFILNVSQFFNQEALSDILLKIADNTYFAHKFVLAKSSEVFRTMLYDQRYTQASSPEIELNESIECQQYFDRFLKFLYTAEININVDSAVGILCLADKYNVTSLKLLCTKYMVKNTRSPKVKNALNWYSWAKALNLGDLIDQCSKTIAWNTDLILKMPEWLDMDFDFLKDLLSNSQLVVQEENCLFLALTSWLFCDQHKTNMEDHSKQLLPLIRYPQMQVSQLYEIEKLAKEDENYATFRELLLELISKAYRFRSLCPSQAELEVSFNQPFYLPRNYMSLTVDNVRMQNTLRFGIQVDVRTYVGPVPSENKEGEWKITYRKNQDSWTLQIYGHESAMINGEAEIQSSVVIYNEYDHVIQVDAAPTQICSRNNNLSMTINVPKAEEAKTMAVLIKPMPK